MILTNENFINYAMRHYENPSCKSLIDFNEDLQRFKYLKRILSRYLIEPNQPNFRLILNHITILYNVFEQNACTSMLFYKTTEEHWTILVPILDKLNYLPEFVIELGLDVKNIERNKNVEEDIINAFFK